MSGFGTPPVWIWYTRCLILSTTFPKTYNSRVITSPLARFADAPREQIQQAQAKESELRALSLIGEASTSELQAQATARTQAEAELRKYSPDIDALSRARAILADRISSAEAEARQWVRKAYADEYKKHLRTISKQIAEAAKAHKVLTEIHAAAAEAYPHDSMWAEETHGAKSVPPSAGLPPLNITFFQPALDGMTQTVFVPSDVWAGQVAEYLKG